MLEELAASNLGLIASASVALGEGLTVVTGETGAGKRITEGRKEREERGRTEGSKEGEKEGDAAISTKVSLLSATLLAAYMA